MKLIKTFIVATAGLALSVLPTHASLTLDFSALPGSTLQFNGAASSFQFNDSTYYPGFQWWITSESGSPAPANSAMLLKGAVGNGPFNYGAITVNGSDEYATVSAIPSGALSINDGAGNYLTGDINWMQLATHLGAGYVGSINAALTVNLTGLAYAGANADLMRVVSEGATAGSMDVAFTFNPGKTLTQLSTGAPSTTGAYAGSIGVVPEPTTMIAGALLLLPFGASTIRMLRKNRAA